MARKKGWLSRISPGWLGGRWAYLFDMYYDLKEGAGSPDPLARKHLVIGGSTLLELLYRQAGQHRFDPRSSMHTPINITVTPADMPEFLRIVPHMDDADLFWHNRTIQSVGDIMSVQDELQMVSVFKGDPKLLGATHILYVVRHDRVHGAGRRLLDPRLVMWTLRMHLEKNLEQLEPLPAVFLLVGGIRATARGDDEESESLYRASNGRAAGIC